MKYEIPIEGVTELPTAIIKHSHNNETSTAQLWKFKDAKIAELVFSALCADLHGDPRVGPLLMRAQEDGSTRIILMWRTEADSIRQQIWEQLSESEPWVRMITKIAHNYREHRLGPGPVPSEGLLLDSIQVNARATAA
jgi:hypothetical protein